ncbi:MAG TPA: NAD(P)-dependent alcohol dehydrogenase [Dehalococcoidia bacterium]|nr:NAD(P)-dependent alcohol dehydrogenase [Dehalococcoidia bacterium]
MKAAVHTRYGPPQVIRVIDVPKPTPQADELLVRVRASTVNRTDCHTRAGTPFFAKVVTGLRKPKATVLGNEFAGEVEAIGSDVSSFDVGDRVFGYNEGPFGAHAEYMTIAEDRSIAMMPTNLSFEDTAPGTEGSHYALAMIRAAKVDRGHDVIVNGATGAIGSAAVQILVSLGANVTAVCGTESVALVEAQGADRVIDYRREDFTADGQTFDVVFDAVGKSTFGQCKRLLRPSGIYFSSEMGPWAQNPILALVSPLSRGRKVMMPIPKHNQQMINYFKELMESGQFRPVIDRRYSLDQIVEAHTYVETGQKIGNVVITIGD